MAEETTTTAAQKSTVTPVPAANQTGSPKSPDIMAPGTTVQDPLQADGVSGLWGGCFHYQELLRKMIRLLMPFRTVTMTRDMLMAPRESLGAQHESRDG